MALAQRIEPGRIRHAGFGLPACLAAALALAVGASAFAEDLSSLDIENRGQIVGVNVAKPDLPAADANADLTFDVEWLYRASALMGEPVINCGVRIRNLAGSVSFEHRGETVSVAITPENAGQVKVYHVDLLVYLEGGVVPTALKCDAGIVAGEGTQPFNVAGSPSLDRMLCQFPITLDRLLPDRFDESWCGSLGGRFLSAESARAMFADEARQRSARVGLGALSVSVMDLVTAERARLREEARQAEAGSGGRSDAAARLQAALDRLGGHEEPREDGTDRRPATAGEAAATDRLGAALSGLAERRREAERVRAEEEARAARADIDQAHEAALARCEEGAPSKPTRRRVFPELVFLTSSNCDSACKKRADARRAEEYRREQLEVQAAYERAMASYEQDLAHWRNTARPACIAEANRNHAQAISRLEQRSTQAGRLRNMLGPRPAEAAR